MDSITARDAKNRFGKLLDAAQREPVAIEKHGRPVAVMMSAADYEEVQALKLDALRAKIERGQAEADAGRTTPGEDVFGELRALAGDAPD